MKRIIRSLFCLSFFCSSLVWSYDPQATADLLTRLRLEELSHQEVSALLFRGADPNAQDTQSQFDHACPLLLAMRWQNPSVPIVRLIAGVANLNQIVRSSGGQVTLLQAYFEEAPADLNQVLAVVPILLERGVRITPGCVQAMRVYRAALADDTPRFQEFDQRILYHRAAILGHFRLDIAQRRDELGTYRQMRRMGFTMQDLYQVFAGNHGDPTIDASMVWRYLCAQRIRQDPSRQSLINVLPADIWNIIALYLIGLR